MGQISFKLPEEEMEFLRWMAKQSAQPVSSIYRNVTLEAFREWKIQALLKEYQKGTIGLKELCRIGNFSFRECSLLLEKNNIEPPITALMDLKSALQRDRLTVQQMFKDGKVPRRQTIEKSESLNSI